MIVFELATAGSPRAIGTAATKSHHLITIILQANIHQALMLVDISYQNYHSYQTTKQLLSIIYINWLCLSSIGGEVPMINPVVQKMQGKLKQAQGKLQEITGDTLGGKVRQIEGKAEEDIAELRIRRNRNQVNESEEESIAREEREKEVEETQDPEDIDVW